VWTKRGKTKIGMSARLKILLRERRVSVVNEGNQQQVKRTFDNANSGNGALCSWAPGHSDSKNFGVSQK